VEKSSLFFQSGLISPKRVAREAIFMKTLPLAEMTKFSLLPLGLGSSDVSTLWQMAKIVLHHSEARPHWVLQKARTHTEVASADADQKHGRLQRISRSSSARWNGQLGKAVFANSEDFQISVRKQFNFSKLQMFFFFTDRRRIWPSAPLHETLEKDQES